jgi:hypothetical protein
MDGLIIWIKKNQLVAENNYSVNSSYIWFEPSSNKVLKRADF